MVLIDLVCTDTVKPDLSDTILSTLPILLFNTLLGIGSSLL